MANQKEIRVKISSTKKTMKITSAMKLVAAAKVNKMQKRLVAARPYAQKINELFANLKNSLSADELQANPLLTKKTNAQNVLLVVLSSDRGLCGAYNANIIKAATKRIKELKAEGKNVQLLTVGRKAKTAFSKISFTLDGVNIIKSFVNLNSIPTNLEANLIAEEAKELFLSGKVDKVELVYTKFISLVSNFVELIDFLPCSFAEDDSVKAKHDSLDVILEPNPQTLIDAVVPMYVENRVYQALMESTTSELAARMTAMSNATTNAKDFIRRLLLKYNKARQASITQEISEIVGGAAALVG